MSTYFQGLMFWFWFACLFAYKCYFQLLWLYFTSCLTCPIRFTASICLHIWLLVLLIFSSLWTWKKLYLNQLGLEKNFFPIQLKVILLATKYLNLKYCQWLNCSIIFLLNLVLKKRYFSTFSNLPIPRV